MYHTEGFVNRHTINTEKHIIMLALEQEGRAWYLWCVVKEGVAKIEELKQLLSFWLQQTLLTKGCNAPASAQRELNRLGGYLQNMDRDKFATDDIELFMYYQGRFYQWDGNGLSENCYCDYCTEDAMKKYREISTGIYGYVSEETLWTQYLCDNDKPAIEPEALANFWELSLLESCNIGEIEHGFFLIWEDKIVF